VAIVEGHVKSFEGYVMEFWMWKLIAVRAVPGAPTDGWADR